MVVANDERSFLVMGNGDLLESDDGILAIGSGGNYALASARALLGHTEMMAEEIVHESMRIAGDLCVYTNHNLSIEKLSASDDSASEKRA